MFQREILEHHRLPYFTDAIFSLSGDDANLSLHNYTLFQNLLALPLVRSLGVVATFNVVMLLTRVLTAFAMFLLARHVTGRTGEAWIAGLAFAWSPVLVTRSMGHFSLMAAAPLAVFLLILVSSSERERWGWREAGGLGLTLWWATSTDPYYGVYCLLLGTLFLAARTVRVTRPADDPVRSIRITLDVLIAAVAALVLAVALSGGWRFAIFDQPVSIRSLYTPVLLLTLLVGARIAWHFRLHLAAVDRGDVWRSVRVVTGAGVATAVLLSPMLYALARRVMLSWIRVGHVLLAQQPAGRGSAVARPAQSQPPVVARTMAVVAGQSHAGRVPGERRVGAVCRDRRHDRRLDARLAAVALVGPGHRVVWLAGARAFRARSGCEHVRAGALGPAAIRAPGGAGSNARRGSRSY